MTYNAKIANFIILQLFPIKYFKIKKKEKEIT